MRLATSLADPTGLMKKIWLSVLLVVVIGSVLVLWQKDKTVEFSDESTGVSFQILEEYKQEFREDKQPSESNKLVAHFIRTDPPALITVRYETGLRKVRAFLRRSPTEHFMAEISQFFPVKYEGYEFRSLEKQEVNGQEYVEHIFGYKDKDDSIKARLLVFPSGEDTAYYLMIQGKEQDFINYAKDLDTLKDSIEFTGFKQFN